MSSDGALKRFLRFGKRCAFKVLPEETYLRLLYRIRFGKRLDLENPRAFSEKIYRLKQINGELFTPLMQRCYDKVDVRGYVLEKLGETRGEEILNELYGVYERPEDIDFEELPNAFVLKVTQSSGFNIICPDKTKLDKEEAIRQLSHWQHISANTVTSSEEGYVYNGNPKICCEKFLSLEDGTIPPDVRIYCFNGEPKLFVCDFETTKIDGTHGTDIKRNVYDMDWNLLEVDFGRPRDASIKMAKPAVFEEMVDVARKLSADFPFVRVDLYDLSGNIVFGELTWIPMGGNCIVNPDSFDLELGSWLEIPDRDEVARRRKELVS